MKGSIADLLRVRTADRDHAPDPDHIPEVAVAVGRAIEVTIVRDNSDHTTTVAHTTSHASRALTIRITVAAAIISRIETVSTTISTTIVLVIVAAVALIIVVVVVAVIVVVDSFMANKASVISVTGATSGIVEPHRAIDTVIAATHPIR